MPDIDISPAGVAKLSNLNVSKAAGQDSIRPIVLKELNQVIAPVVTMITLTSLDSAFLLTGRRPKYSLSSKKMTRQSGQLSTDVLNLYTVQNNGTYSHFKLVQTFKSK